MKVVVTGSSSGMGDAICLKFLESGFEVYGLDISHDTKSTISNFHFQNELFR